MERAGLADAAGTNVILRVAHHGATHSIGTAQNERDVEDVRSGLSQDASHSIAGRIVVLNLETCLCPDVRSGHKPVTTFINV